jgi:thiol-disulfide isomerase/thioredoxin
MLYTGSLVAIAVLLVTPFGCGPESPPADDGTETDAAVTPDAPDPAEPAPADTPGETASEITLRLADVAAYDEVIAGHRGKVVLVDFWATWCTHCVAQFPHTVKLHNDFGDRGLAVVSVSFDDEEDKEEALKMLKKFGADFDNLLSQYGGGTQSTEAFQVDGGLPSYKLYDRKGQLRYTLADTDPDKPLTSEDIDARVKELLAEGAVEPES